MKSNIREEIRNLKIFSKRLVHSAMAGDYAAAFKGTGFEFDQIREYVAGDDVRFVDWNASAKAGSLMVKECVPERDRTIIFAIDCSASNLYSSQENLRKTVILQVASALAFIANNTHDKVGALLFSDTVHQWFAPKCGEGHIAKILESIYSITASGKATNFSECFKFLADLRKKNAVLFVISDWIAGCDESSHEGYIQYERLLKLISCEYDLVAVRVLDECEYDFPR
ncbi:DUF58 domain-containing protein, partial [Candidatus Babeliales bacterium]|nr:DUF58 domain-containing protein [Candidatus Babeliales bacterium]